MNHLHCNTPDKPFNPVLPFRAKSTRLRVRAQANQAGWYFIIADYETRTPVHRDIGQMPEGFTFNQATAELYALACAHRWLACNLPRAVVAMVNTAQQSRRAA